MNVAIELPEDVAELLQQKWGNLSQYTLETLAVESYRTGLLSHAQLRRMLGFEIHMEVDAFLKLHGVYLAYTEEDLKLYLETSREWRASRQSRATVIPERLTYALSQLCMYLLPQAKYAPVFAPQSAWLKH